MATSKTFADLSAAAVAKGEYIAVSVKGDRYETAQRVISGYANTWKPGSQRYDPMYIYIPGINVCGNAAVVEAYLTAEFGAQTAAQLVGTAFTSANYQSQAPHQYYMFGAGGLVLVQGSTFANDFQMALDQHAAAAAAKKQATAVKAPVDLQVLIDFAKSLGGDVKATVANRGFRVSVPGAGLPAPAGAAPKKGGRSVGTMQAHLAEKIAVGKDLNVGGTTVMGTGTRVGVATDRSVRLSNNGQNALYHAFFTRGDVGSANWQGAANFLALYQHGASPSAADFAAAAAEVTAMLAVALVPPAPGTGITAAGPARVRAPKAGGKVAKAPKAPKVPKSPKAKAAKAKAPKPAGKAAKPKAKAAAAPVSRARTPSVGRAASPLPVPVSPPRSPVRTISPPRPVLPTAALPKAPMPGRVALPGATMLPGTAVRAGLPTGLPTGLAARPGLPGAAVPGLPGTALPRAAIPGLPGTRIGGALLPGQPIARTGLVPPPTLARAGIPGSTLRAGSPVPARSPPRSPRS